MIQSRFGCEVEIVGQTVEQDEAGCVLARRKANGKEREYSIIDLRADEGIQEIEAAIEAVS